MHGGNMATQEEKQKLRTKAYDEYEDKERPFREEYDKKITPLWEEYQKKTDAIWKEYEKKLKEIEAMV